MDGRLDLEGLLQSVSTYDRDMCKSQLRRVKHIDLDFTDEYLDGLSLERLRHLLMAALIQAARHARRFGRNLPIVD